MKSLDEVIEEMQLKSDVNRHYREENADVLNYLVLCRNYKKQMEIVEQIKQDAVRQRDAHIKALADLKRNDPLTWDELRQMEGKPVWWMHGEVGEWITIYRVPTLGNGNDNVIYATLCSGPEYWIWRKDMNKFQYYRKERHGKYTD